MKHTPKFLLVLAALIGLQCSSEKQEISKYTPEEATATPPKEWIEQRVTNARKRLAETKEGQLLWKAMKKHGGLDRWYANGPLYFRFDYNNLKTGGPDTYQTVDTWSSRARHQLATDTTVEYGWDGEKAWKYPPDAEIEENPRFWALSPFYFTGMPFVLADEGINLKYIGPNTFEEKEYHQIRATFDQGKGDSPDDFYVIYVNTRTFRVGGLRYVVSYPGFYAKDEHGPVKHMVYYGEQTVDGILFPRSIKTFKWEEKGPAEHTTNITISDIQFRPDTPADYFKVPEGSRVMEGYQFD